MNLATSTTTTTITPLPMAMTSLPPTSSASSFHSGNIFQQQQSQHALAPTPQIQLAGLHVVYETIHVDLLTAPKEGKVVSLFNITNNNNCSSNDDLSPQLLGYLLPNSSPPLASLHQHQQHSMTPAFTENTSTTSTIERTTPPTVRKLDNDKNEASSKQQHSVNKHCSKSSKAKTIKKKQKKKRKAKTPSSSMQQQQQKQQLSLTSPTPPTGASSSTEEEHLTDATSTTTAAIDEKRKEALLKVVSTSLTIYKRSRRAQLRSPFAWISSVKPSHDMIRVREPFYSASTLASTHSPPASSSGSNCEAEPSSTLTKKSNRKQLRTIL